MGGGYWNTIFCLKTETVLSFSEMGFIYDREQLEVEAPPTCVTPRLPGALEQSRGKRKFSVVQR